MLRQLCHCDFLLCPSKFILHINMAFDTANTLYMKNVVKLIRNEILNIIKHILWSPLEQTVNMQLFNNPFVVKEQKHLLQYHTNCDYNLTWATSDQTTSSLIPLTVFLIFSCILPIEIFCGVSNKCFLSPVHSYVFQSLSQSVWGAADWWGSV
jgi:hypothetical protein